MKKYYSLAIACLFLLFSLLLLTSCVNNSGYYKAQVRNDLVQENWMKGINLSTRNWTAHADSWFFTDEPSKFEDYASRAPESRAITAMMVRVPDFCNINVGGSYRVQIYGRQLHNSLYILGPNDAARHTAVDIQGNTISIHPATDCTNCTNLNEVIIRIGVRELNSLTNTGNSMVEGKDITSRNLEVASYNQGEILLTGYMNLTKITQSGGGTTSIIGAYTPNLKVNIPSNGNVNISGHVGVSQINKTGSGCLNIIGADTDSLKIESSGSGTTTISGYANLKKINVVDNSRVYLYWVSSHGIYANVHNNARLGLAGSTSILDVEVDGSARFEGKYLHADSVYVRTRDSSHANVYPGQKLFATAMDNSSIYFFGSPNVVSRYMMGHGQVIPVWCDACNAPMAPPLSAQIVKPTFKVESGYAGLSSFKGEHTYNPRRNFKDEQTFQPVRPHKKVKKHKVSYKDEQTYQ